MEAIELMMQRPWAIETNHLRTLVSIAQRHARGECVDLEAISKEVGKPLRNTKRVVEKRGIAVVPISGPIFPKANLMTEISGATSAEVLMQDIVTAQNSPEIRGILLDVDSPGGLVKGIDEASEFIYKSRQNSSKPIIAHVSGNCCSAAYWIASAAQAMFVAPTSIVGSIGVVATVQRGEDDGEIEIVSRHAPNKRLDPESEEGRNAIQEEVDAIESVFLENVARNRGVGIEDVITDYGQGGTCVGSYAVERGMADGVLSHDDAVELLLMMAS